MRESICQLTNTYLMTERLQGYVILLVNTKRGDGIENVEDTKMLLEVTICIMDGILLRFHKT